MSNIFHKISIIIPSLNQGNYIQKTLNSIVEQNYPNVEIIVVDGGSKDQTLRILKKFKKYINIFIYKKDKSQANAINIGIRSATGNWIGWQNSDDCYIGKSLYEVNKIINLDRYDVISGNINLIDKNDNYLRSIIFNKPNYKSLLAEGMLISNQATFWKKELHKRVGYINEKYNFSFDYDFFIRLLQKGKVFHIHKYLGALRIHEKSKSYNFNEKFFLENKEIRKNYKNYRKLKYIFTFFRLVYYLYKFEFSYVFKGFMSKLIK